MLATPFRGRGQSRTGVPVQRNFHLSGRVLTHVEPIGYLYRGELPVG